MFPIQITVSAYLAQRAREQPDHPAVIVQGARRADGKFEYHQYTFRELDHEATRLARGLSASGLTRGMRTALMVTPGLDFFALVFALFRSGAVPVLIDPGMGIKNLGQCLNEAAPEAFIGISKAHAARVLLGWASESLKLKITVGTRWFWGGLTIEDLQERGDKSATEFSDQPQADDPAAILFTSGSTGVPKGALYTHGIFAEQIRVLREDFGIAPGERDLATFPLFALFGPALGMTAIIPDMDATRPARADPEKLSAALLDHQATNMFGSPALLNRLARHLHPTYVPLKQREAGSAATSVAPLKTFPSLKRMLSAGAPVSAEIIERFTPLLNAQAEIFTPYGATEALPVCKLGSREILSQTRAQTSQGKGICVGRPVGHVKVAVIKISDEPVATWNEALRVPVGEIGEITVQGPAVTREYYQRVEATRLAKIPDPAGTPNFWHRMGDLGYQDDQGRIWFCGRKSHRVITPQGTLFTIPCEGVFNAHPTVFRTALVGVGRPNSQTPVICVELDSESAPCCGLTREQLRAELLSLGACHSHTRGIQTILFHPAFPVDIRHNAKIFREKLAVWAEKHR